MKTVLSMALGLTLCVASDVRQVQSQSLNERVLLLTGGTWNSSLIAISSGEGLVVVDTYDTPEATAEALAKAQKHFPGERVRFLINTHGHDDHVWGNEIFEGVPIIAHRHTRRYMADRQRELVPFFSGQRIRDLESQLDHEQERSDEETADLRERVLSRYSVEQNPGKNSPTRTALDSCRIAESSGARQPPDRLNWACRIRHRSGHMPGRTRRNAPLLSSCRGLADLRDDPSR